MVQRDWATVEADIRCQRRARRSEHSQTENKFCLIVLEHLNCLYCSNLLVRSCRVICALQLLQALDSILNKRTGLLRTNIENRTAFH